MRKLFFLWVFPVSLALTGCTTMVEYLPGVYTLEIQQGNMVDQDMINQLKPNMSKRQVLYIMGTPMLADVFHDKRWDYLYSMQKSGEETEKKRISLYFEGDTLTAIEGDFKPDGKAPKPVKETIVDVPKRDIELTMWEKVLWVLDLDTDSSAGVKEDKKSSGDENLLKSTF